LQLRHLNGLTLSALSPVPIITVSASVRDFPEDVWSSLRTPSNVPVMMVLEPANAVLAVLQILSARNPRLYARVRGDIESRSKSCNARSAHPRKLKHVPFRRNGTSFLQDASVQLRPLGDVAFGLAAQGSE
jgi:phosphoribosylcarboxyaminoimidazole (NCAIR) mutase